MHYQIYKDVNNQWRWRFVANNNRIVANSGEGYHNKADCQHAISLIAQSGTAKVYEV